MLGSFWLLNKYGANSDLTVTELIRCEYIA